MELAHEPLVGRLARMKLASRELPAPGERLARRPLRDQHAARSVEQRAGDDLDLAHASRAS
jgi:hypothetical protein